MRFHIYYYDSVAYPQQKFAGSETELFLFVNKNKSFRGYMIYDFINPDSAFLINQNAAAIHIRFIGQGTTFPVAEIKSLGINIFEAQLTNMQRDVLYTIIKGFTYETLSDQQAKITDNRS